MNNRILFFLTLCTSNLSQTMDGPSNRNIALNVDKTSNQLHSVKELIEKGCILPQSTMASLIEALEMAEKETHAIRLQETVNEVDKLMNKRKKKRDFTQLNELLPMGYRRRRTRTNANRKKILETQLSDGSTLLERTKDDPILHNELLQRNTLHQAVLTDDIPTVKSITDQILKEAVTANHFAFRRSPIRQNDVYGATPFVYAQARKDISPKIYALVKTAQDAL